MKSVRKNTMKLLLLELRGMWGYMLINTLICLIYEALPFINIFLLSYLIGSLLSCADIAYTLYFVLLIVNTVLQGVFGYANMWTEHDIAYRMLYKLRYKIYERLEKALPCFAAPMMSSELTAIVTSDMNFIEWFYAHTLNIFIVSRLLIAALLGFLTWVHPFYAMNAAFWIALCLATPLIFKRRSEADGRKLRESYGALANASLDAVQGMREILSFK